MKFICKVYHPEQNIILLNKEYDSLKALGEELGLSYNQVADLSCEKKEIKNTFTVGKTHRDHFDKVTAPSEKMNESDVIEDKGIQLPDLSEGL